MQALFKVGDKVFGRFLGRTKWYPATVSCIGDDGLYDLAYDDGDVEERVHQCVREPNVMEQEGGKRSRRSTLDAKIAWEERHEMPQSGSRERPQSRKRSRERRRKRSRRPCHRNASATPRVARCWLPPVLNRTI